VDLTEMHVNKMLFVLKNVSPWVWSRSFLLQLFAITVAATAAGVTATAVLLAPLHP